MSQILVKNKIEELIKKADFTIDSCDVIDEDGTLWCNIRTQDSRFLIGKDGETLRSFNHLIKKMIEKELGEEQCHEIMIDGSGYQKKRMDTLKAPAHMLAERVR